MNQTDFIKLGRGDLIRHKAKDQDALMVSANYGGRVTAVTTQDVINPDEWELVAKAKYSFPQK